MSRVLAVSLATSIPNAALTLPTSVSTHTEMFISFKFEYHSAHGLKYIGSMLPVFLFFTLIATSSMAQTDFSKASTKVLMLEIEGVTPNDPELYRAILAQLSSSPLTLEREEIVSEENFNADPRGNSFRLAETRGAAMVFWIEEKETCRLHFFIPDTNGGRIRSRILKLETNSAWSRFQIIAIAAASMVEGLFVTHQLNSVVTPPVREPSPEALPIKKEPTERKKWFGLFGAYAGSIFTDDLVTHGACLGVELLPLKYVVFGVSFVQNVSIHQKTKEYQLTIKSRNLEASLAAKIGMGSIAIRPGIAFAIELRSFSNTIQAENIDATPNGFKAINFLIPFVSAIWKFNDTLGIVGRIGMGVALNDTVYTIGRNDDRVTEELTPLRVRMNYQAGLIVQF